MRVRAGGLLSVSLLVLFVAPSTTAEFSSAPQPPFPEYHVTPLNHILYPRLTSPAFVAYGDALTAWIARTDDLPSSVTWSAYLESAFTEDWRYALDAVDQGFDDGVGGWWVTVRVPEDVPPGLYNLTVEGSGLRFTEPNSVYVFGDSYPTEIRVIQFTDTHYGTRDIPKHHRNQQLFRMLVATINGLRPDVVVHTGDVIDAIARPDEEDPFREAYRDLVRLRVPLIAVEGNNDYTAVEKKQYYWEKYFGPFYGVVDVGPNFHFVQIDSDTGKIFGYQFDLIESLLEGKGGTGAVLTHYPLMDQDIRVWLYGPDGKFQGTLDYNQTVQRVVDIAHMANAPVVLTGHWHSDDQGAFGDVLCLVTEAGQHDHGTSYGGPEGDFGHYRHLRFTADGGFWYQPSSPSVSELGAEYLQAYDGSSYAVAIRVWNKGQEEVTLRLPVVLSSFDPSPKVEGAELSAAYGASGKGAYELTVALAPGEERVVKIYLKPDQSPPKISADLKDAKDGRKEIWPRITDEGLGVLEYRVYVSPDNSTWSELEPEFDTGWPVWRVSPDQYRYFKITATDAAGNEAEFFGEISKLAPATTTPAPTPQPGSEEGAGLASNLVLWIAGIVVVAVAALLALRRGSK
ncbi:MAG: metallophosphoesterase [Candidatus Korarchaeota archaeon]|nr:metallophosphoesterase [Candidatus Korarchaeota archaeon]